mgnify:CR=1 FL=1
MYNHTREDIHLSCLDYDHRRMLSAQHDKTVEVQKRAEDMKCACEACFKVVSKYMDFMRSTARLNKLPTIPDLLNIAADYESLASKFEVREGHSPSGEKHRNNTFAHLQEILECSLTKYSVCIVNALSSTYNRSEFINKSTSLDGPSVAKSKLAQEMEGTEAWKQMQMELDQYTTSREGILQTLHDHHRALSDIRE